MTAPEPVTGATQDDDARLDAVAEFVRRQFDSRSDSPVALAGHRLIARRFIAAADAADAAAGIRRVPAAELERLRGALEWTEENFRLAVNGKAVRDMAENLAENATVLGRGAS